MPDCVCKFKTASIALGLVAICLASATPSLATGEINCKVNDRNIRLDVDMLVPRDFAMAQNVNTSLSIIGRSLGGHSGPYRKVRLFGYWVSATPFIETRLFRMALLFSKNDDTYAYAIKIEAKESKISDGGHAYKGKYTIMRMVSSFDQEQVKKSGAIVCEAF